MRNYESVKRVIIIVLICVCIITNGCTINNHSKNNSNSVDVQGGFYSFLNDYSDVGSYSLVKQYETAGGMWYSNTDDLYDYAWSQCLNVWNSYITLYETSGDIIWLEKLSCQIDEILDKRDSVIKKIDRNGFSLPSWSYTTDDTLYKPYHNPVMIGLIIYPILRFVETVKEDNILTFEEKANEYLKASIDVLSVLDLDVDEYNNFEIPVDACQDLWRERQEESGMKLGYYVGHNFYNDDYFKDNGFITGNPLPYNQSLSVAQCYPVLYRILGDAIWKEKSEKSWNWFRETGFDKTDDISWWYYSEYFNWCRTNAEPIRNVAPPEDGSDYYEDYEGHYSIDLMFIIEIHKIGMIDDDKLSEISRNKKEMGLSSDGWLKTMNISSNGDYNLKTAVYFDYFVCSLEDNEYLDIVFPIIRDEMERQYSNGIFADNSSNVNGTCLRLLTSAYRSKTCAK